MLAIILTTLIVSAAASSAEKCPKNHDLTQYTVGSGQHAVGTCDVCSRCVSRGENVLNCSQCNWWKCKDCQDIHEIDTPRPAMESPPRTPEASRPWTYVTYEIKALLQRRNRGIRGPAGSQGYYEPKSFTEEEAREYVQKKGCDGQKWVSKIRLNKITISANNMYKYLQDYFLNGGRGVDITDSKYRTTQMLWEQEQDKRNRYQKCSHGHALTPLKHERTRYCDICRERFEKGALMHSCRGCDFDACPACFEGRDAEECSPLGGAGSR